MRLELPDRADVVVIGGGIIGLATAYNLAAAGVGRVLLVDSGTFGGGSTCRAAGGVRALFSDEINIRLGLRSLQVWERFAHDFGQEIDLHRSGYLFLLDNERDAQVFEANTELQNALGVPSRMIDVAEAKRLSPLISTDGLVGALFSPEDGHCTPESAVLGYAAAARRAGATLVSNCAASGIEVDGGRVVAVATAAGRIATDTVVCAAGAWSRQVAAWAGVDLPVEPLRRQIVVTEPVDGLDPQTPFTIDFTSSLYFHREGGGLLLGMTEQEDSWGFDLSRPRGWLDQLAEAMAHRAPSLAEVGIASGWAGLYEMTPDHNALIGRASDVEGLLYACGFSGHGFLMGPAVGEVMCDLVLGAAARIDVSALDVRRFAAEDDRPELNII